ncbi:MAG: hypothetical protein VB085_08815 [Peptococcaceae bacterium]|nr:hypothetical protein [Peptococcaceae bacterium]
MTQVSDLIYSWSSIRIIFPRREFSAQSIGYDDEVNKEAVYGMGQRPRGVGKGNYSATGKMDLTRGEFQDLLDYCKAEGVGLYNLVIPQIVVAYANDGERTRIDVLKNVTPTKASQTNSQGDTSLKVSLDLLIGGGIIRDGVEPV